MVFDDNKKPAENRLAHSPVADGHGRCLGYYGLRPRIVTQAPKTEVPLVSVIQVEPQTIRLNVHSQGIVTPRNEIDLIPEVAGKVIHLHPDFVAGGFFDRNDLLVSHRSARL